MPSIYQNLYHERDYKAATGLAKEEFDRLHITFAKYYKTKSANAISGRSAAFTDAREALFFILFYYKTYPTISVLGLTFGVAPKTADGYIDYIKPYLKQALSEQQVLVKRVFKDQQSFEEAFQGVEEICMDGTELPVQRAQDNHAQQKDYSGKKNSIP